MKSIQLLPKASSLIESLRDIGYSFESAVADIIDNSITAKAKNIHIYFDFKDKKLSLAIIDDGLGMDEEELIEAMRPGTKNPLESRDENDLGRFGLGLKTASFSQCRKLTVVSSQENYRVATVWDLDYVAQTEDWSLQVLDNNELSTLYKIDKLKRDGTMVIWEKTDRIVDNSVSEANEDVVYEKIENLQNHLELVFHRYLKGKDNLTQELVGVGLNNNQRIPGSLTSTLNDFKKTNLQSLGIDPKDYVEPIILVIKKNYSTLNNIINWLKGTTTEDKLSSYPLLIIDDEADNASINTKKDPNEATKINKQIREILNMFDRRCYIGYTATPFANIFINPEGEDDKIGEDLFPEDFIIALEAPSNYVGAKTIFLDESEKILREIEDNEPCLPVKHNKEFSVNCLPQSLYEAIYVGCNRMDSFPIKNFKKGIV